MRLITYSIVTLLSLIVFVIGCTKETINKTCENFAMPKQTVLDFDNDGTTDFIISYEALTWDGFNSSGNSINGLLKSQNDNEILFSGNSDKFFYKLNDTIKETPKFPQYWEASDVYSVIKIEEEFFYDKNGKVTIERTCRWVPPDCYSYVYSYIGVKIKQADKNLIGWLKIELNTNSGEISIIDKEFSYNDLIINR